MEYSRSTDEPTSVAVATALAQFEESMAIAPKTCLYEYVDPDALDALFADRPNGRSRPTGSVRFSTESATIVVRPEIVRVFDRVSRPPPE
ncbi:HalOD1 output domain-containing protein [Halovivax gelatinilyticus]|uniref:HalOD1 output domain-containing protein n=1 Tax=Halovivax gelatinilyticus TaxID=2961597 RepID=UPI0020CA8832|nr:HalOD1 output domain-containing protein [Halovivax gelatinilyticus]